MLEKMCEYKEKSKRKQSVSIICKVFKNIRSGKFNSSSNTIWSYYFKIFITLMSWVVSRMNCTMSWTRDANNGNCWFFIIFFLFVFFFIRLLWLFLHTFSSALHCCTMYMSNKLLWPSIHLWCVRCFFEYIFSHV